MNITQRLEKLEKLVTLQNDPFTVIVRFVSPGPVQPEVTHARRRRQHQDWRLTRDPDESLEAFTKRAAVLAPRNEHGVASIILDSDDE